jgi:hypothetical protein
MLILMDADSPQPSKKEHLHQIHDHPKFAFFRRLAPRVPGGVLRESALWFL